MSRLSASLAASVLAFVVALACDPKGKEGEACFSPTAESTDCAEGLVCAKCAEGNICVRAEGDLRGDRLMVQGRTCGQLHGVAELSEVQRGVPGG